MPIRRYLPALAFEPEVVKAMGDAFEGAVEALGIRPDDQSRREAVAQFILELVRSEGEADLMTLRDRTIKALSERG